MISRVKVLSELDISERRVPQDGRFKVSWQGREIDIRVSIMPSIWGEDAVLRVLDKQALTDHLKGCLLYTSRDRMRTAGSTSTPTWPKYAASSVNNNGVSSHMLWIRISNLRLPLAIKPCVAATT